MQMLPTICPVCEQDALHYDKDNIYCTNCEYSKPLTWLQKPFAWATDKQPLWRVGILALFVLFLCLNLKDPSYALNRLANPFSMFDFGIHELGHIIFRPFGEFMTILGGSLFQCIFPFLWMAGSIQKRWYFAACMCWCWVGLNLFDVATYAADARARLLPLAAGPGGIGADASDESVYDHAHDWYQILSRTGHLNSDLAIAQGLRIAAVITFLIGFTLGGMLLVRMFKSYMQKRDETA